MGERIPDSGEQAWLIEKLRALVDVGGPAPLRSAPLVVDTPAFFPEPWEATVGGLRRLARRVVKYGGLRDLDIEIAFEDDAAPPESRHELEPTEPSTVTTASCRVTRVEKGRCYMKVTEPVAIRPHLVRELAHETARAYRLAHGLALLASQEDEERAVDVTAVYLGLGVLAAKASVANLSPQAFGFLLGVRTIARREGAAARRATAVLLEPLTRAGFDATIDLLGADAEGLAKNLGLAPEWDSEDALRVEEIVDDVSAEIAADEKARASRSGTMPRSDPTSGVEGPRPFAALAAAAEASRPALPAAPRSRPSLRDPTSSPSSVRDPGSEGVPVFRVRRTRAAAFARAFFLLGLASAVVSVIALGQGLVFALAWTAGVTLVGLFIGRVTTTEFCSGAGCQARLSPDDTRCPGCGRRVVAVLPVKRAG